MSGKRFTLFLLAGCFCSACSRALTGSYADDANVTAYQFRADGTAVITVLGTTVAAEYTLDGDRVLVSSPQGTVVLRQKDDRLIGPMGLELKKRSARD